MNEEKKYNSKKLNVLGKTWHLEFCYDQPIFKDLVFDGHKVQKAIFSFKDIDDDNQVFSTIMTANTKVVSNLLNYRTGDKIDLTFKEGTNRMGQLIHFYDILPLGTTQNALGPQFERQENTVEIGDAHSDEDKLSEIDF